MGKTIKIWILKFENSFFSRVIKRSLAVMIPFVLAGGMACAIRNLPFESFQSMLQNGALRWLDRLLELVYQGTFGIFSLALVMALSASFALEKNVTHDEMVMYVAVALAAFAAQLNIGTEYFQVDSLGTTGCFTAMVLTYLVCLLYTGLRKARFLTLEEFTVGIGGSCVPALQTFLPMVIVVASSAILNQLITLFFHVHGFYELANESFCELFNFVATSNNFLTGLLYTVCVQILWFFGMHGSHILEPVAQSTLGYSGQTIFSKPFYDVFVAMGGCGTTICVLIALLIFFRKERTGKLGRLASFTVIFNINEILTFGIPILLNPVLFVPFVLTPVMCYCFSYVATCCGWVPMLQQSVTWTVPVGFGGYLATGSIRGSILQLVCIVTGVGIYYPFLKMNRRMEKERAKEMVKTLISEIQQKELDIERPDFFNRGDLIGTTARVLLQDLKHAIRNRELYVLYQPQVGADGRCIGSEALLRWKHPVYGMIYPPLIIYLAEEGKLLPELEKLLLDEVCAGIASVGEQYSGEFKVSINLTAHSLLWEVEECIRVKLEEYHIPPQRLWIEITEQDILLQTDLVTEKLGLLKEKGHTLLIDDFGMGHTSLLYLQSNYFGVVKLDGSLVRPLLTNTTNQKIVSSIVDLAKELGITVIAEYVENKEQQELLEKLGCTCYQGYYYSKPVPLEEFIAYMNKNSQT